ncbi:hypothetical protein OH76DRAFT_1487773 [Lentinus brumalis]|uniref:Uncharacterized protein n=1 Tax=Lentinus brumalis TaxID=2498619 RepID=A0A371CTA2_9APHY|nr:hypothetical protein OH76DRAFT_1487773 [Polyporus brumalis]
MTRLEGRHGALINDDDRAPGPLIGHVEGHLRVAKQTQLHQNRDYSPRTHAANTTTTATHDVVAHLTQSSSSSPSTLQKDYSAAFGALQTQYGWGPVTSVPVRSTQMTEAQERTNAAKEKKAKAEAKRKGESRSQPKDYESAFGALSSKMGFGGTWTPSAGQRKL